MGLDDLPPDVVASLVAGARPCLPADSEWWVDDVAPEIAGQYGFSDDEARCVATNLVDRIGIDAVLERRVLTIPLLTLTDAELAAVDLASCGVTHTLPPIGVGAAGECLADVFESDERPDVVPCDEPHNAEILTTIELADIPTWPGLAAIDDRGREACLPAANQAAPDRDDIGVIWFVPSRQVWERDGRLVTCIIGPIDGTPWTQSSGLTVPPTTGG